MWAVDVGIGSGRLHPARPWVSNQSPKPSIQPAPGPGFAIKALNPPSSPPLGLGSQSKPKTPKTLSTSRQAAAWWEHGMANTCLLLLVAQGIERCGYRRDA